MDDIIPKQNLYGIDASHHKDYIEELYKHNLEIQQYKKDLRSKNLKKYAKSIILGYVVGIGIISLFCFRLLTFH